MAASQRSRKSLARRRRSARPVSISATVSRPMNDSTAISAATVGSTSGRMSPSSWPLRMIEATMSIQVVSWVLSCGRSSGCSSPSSVQSRPMARHERSCSCRSQRASTMASSCSMARGRRSTAAITTPAHCSCLWRRVARASASLDGKWK